jgi:hypothetical protein
LKTLIASSFQNCLINFNFLKIKKKSIKITNIHLESSSQWLSNENLKRSIWSWFEKVTNFHLVYYRIIYQNLSSWQFKKSNQY